MYLEAGNKPGSCPRAPSARGRGTPWARVSGIRACARGRSLDRGTGLRAGGHRRCTRGAKGLLQTARSRAAQIVTRRRRCQAKHCESWRVHRKVRQHRAVPGARCWQLSGLFMATRGYVERPQTYRNSADFRSGELLTAVLDCFVGATAVSPCTAALTLAARRTCCKASNAMMCLARGDRGPNAACRDVPLRPTSGRRSAAPHVPRTRAQR